MHVANVSPEKVITFLMKTQAHCIQLATMSFPWHEGDHLIIRWVTVAQAIGRQKMFAEDDGARPSRSYASSWYVRYLCSKHQVGTQDSPGENVMTVLKNPSPFR